MNGNELNGRPIVPRDLNSPLPLVTPILTCFADIEPREVAWLWPERVPLGRITLIVGRPGEGKSFLTTDMAARVTTGTTWPDGSVCPQGSAILMSAEDDPHDTIRPRLDAHHADVNRVHLLSAVKRSDERGQREQVITLADVQAIEETLKSVPDCKLIVVDPIGSFLGSRTDAHRDNEVRAILSPITALAEKYGPAIVIVAHRRKSTGTSADDLALGSRAFTGIARAVWHVSADSENKERRLMLPGKNNLARGGSGLAFSIVDKPGRIKWEEGAVTMNADEALAVENRGQERKQGPDAHELRRAIEWLNTTLAKGPRPAGDVLDEWKNGQGGTKRTLDRAKASLQVKAYRDKVPGPWHWRLATLGVTIPEQEVLGILGNLTENRADIVNSEVNTGNDAKLEESGILDAKQDQPQGGEGKA